MIHFLLTPDSASALHVRRLVALSGGRMNVVVGTWPELLMHATNSYILPPPADDWTGRLAEAIGDFDDAFWSRSYKTVNTAEREAITSIVGGHLSMLLESLGPNGSMQQLQSLELKSRLQRHVSDFAKLHEKMGAILPPALRQVREFLNAGPERVMRTITVYRIEGWPRLNLWQHALVDHLNTISSASAHAVSLDLAAILESAPFKPSGRQNSSLRFMQEKLFQLPDKRVLDGSSLQWLSVRDCLQEAEVAAGMVQTALRNGSASSSADFGLLLPSDPGYGHVIRSVFDRAGIPLSGLVIENSIRDLGREAVLNLLDCLDKPAPVLALASLFVSPLMPWSSDAGNRLAQRVVESRFDLKAPAGSGDSGQRMLDLIIESVKSPSALAERISAFVKLLDKREVVSMHRERAATLCEELRADIQASAFIDWVALKSKAAPQQLSAAPYTVQALEGVAVFNEGREPWRQVKHLIVLGCFSGHYPATEKTSGIFTDDDLQDLGEKSGISFEISSERNSRQREIFMRQLGAASEEASFFVPCRNALGKPLEPSSSITFAAVLFDGVEKAEDLLLNLESTSHLEKVRGVPRAEAEVAEPLRLSTEDPEFAANLLDIGAGADGTRGSETPSRLETLLVSPLAWMLDRLRLKPQEWTPETFDAKAKGILAHEVFEHLFAPGEPLTDERRIEEQVTMLLETAINKSYPFLNRDEWKVEVGYLRQEILKSARRWGAMLRTIGATVAAAEIELEGTLDGRPINGKADLLLELEGGRLVVVDYKKSSSGTRKKRMEAGCDLQAELYRTMIKTGGVRAGKGVAEETVSFVNRFRNAGEIGTLYYLMNNQVALSNTSGWFGDIGSLEEIDTDVSAKAMADVAASLRDLESGLLRLNSKSDAEEFYKKKGLSTYALELPLVKVFMKPSEQGEEGEATEVADA